MKEGRFLTPDMRYERRKAERSRIRDPVQLKHHLLTTYTAIQRKRKEMGQPLHDGPRLFPHVLKQDL